MVTGVQGDSSSSFPVICSMLIKPRGNHVIMIDFLRGEGGARVGIIKTKGGS